MKKKKKKRNVNPPNPYETNFLKFFYARVDDLHEKNETPISQIAGNIDLDLSNMLRSKRKRTNAKMISAMRLVKGEGHSFGEAVLLAERKADEWQKKEDEKRNNGKSLL